jgi:hypothetical protein
VNLTLTFGATATKRGASGVFGVGVGWVAETSGGAEETSLSHLRYL